MIEWLVGFTLLFFSLGFFFERRPRHEEALAICFLSFLFGLIVYKFIPSAPYTKLISYAMVDLTACFCLLALKFRLLSLCLALSTLHHGGAMVATYLNYSPYFEYYGLALILICIVNIGILFHGSAGYALILELYSRIVGVVGRKECLFTVEWQEYEAYERDLLRQKDFM